jgi:lysophospholipase L1-like esterase
VARDEGFISLLLDNDDAVHPAFKGRDLSSRYPGLKVARLAVGGSDSDDLAAQVARAPANPSGTTLVIITIGGNDLAYNFMALVDLQRLEKVAAKVKSKLEQVFKHFRDRTRYPDGVTLVISNVYDFTDGMGSVPEGVQLNEVCAVLKMALPEHGASMVRSLEVFNRRMDDFARQQNVLLLDLYAAFLGHGFNAGNKASKYYRPSDPSLWFQSDCIHPNAAGHAGIRALAWQVLMGT